MGLTLISEDGKTTEKAFLLPENSHIISKALGQQHKSSIASDIYTRLNLDTIREAGRKSNERV
jgi:hypothetical protein